MSDVAKIASKLTKAQRKDLLNAGCSVPSRMDEYSSDCACAAKDWLSLQDLGLVVPRERFPNGIIRSALGEQVRNHLLSEQSND